MSNKINGKKKRRKKEKEQFFFLTYSEVKTILQAFVWKGNKRGNKEDKLKGGT